MPQMDRLTYGRMLVERGGLVRRRVVGTEAGEDGRTTLQSRKRRAKRRTQGV